MLFGVLWALKGAFQFFERVVLFVFLWIYPFYLVFLVLFQPFFQSFQVFLKQWSLFFPLVVP